MSTIGTKIWNSNGLDGIHIGGGYYRAVNGTIEVPDNISGLEQHGLTAYTQGTTDHPETLQDVNSSEEE